MAAVQFMGAKIGLVTGMDLANVIRRHYPHWQSGGDLGQVLIASAESGSRSSHPASGAVGLPGVIAISANAQHKGCAEQFVNWVLTASGGQNVMITHDPTDGDTYFIPVVQGVTNMVNRQYTGINFIDLNVTQWASVEAEYKQWFHNNIVQ